MIVHVCLLQCYNTWLVYNICSGIHNPGICTVIPYSTLLSGGGGGGRGGVPIFVIFAGTRASRNLESQILFLRDLSSGLQNFTPKITHYAVVL